jgi:lysophospholipase L1-like esterase
VKKKNNDKKTGKKIFFLIILIVFVIGIALLIAGIVFGPNLVVKYSPDGILKESTLSKIYVMRGVLLFCSLIILALVLTSLLRYNKSIGFIVKRKKIIVNLIVLFFTIVFFFIISELVLWAMLKNETSFSSSGPGSANFNKEFVHINAQGFRDNNFSIDREAGTVRIAVAGDSVSFGSGIRNVSNTYPKLLEKMLNNGSSGKYEVYNFGIPGYDANDELKLIKNKVVLYKPDIIVIEYYENDIENVDPELQGAENVENWQLPVVGFWLREISYTYYFFESRFNRAAENLGLKKKWLDTLNVTYNSEANKKYNLEIYKNISEIARENNASVVLVVFPVISDFKNYQFFMVHRFAEKIASENDFHFLDLFNDFSNYTAEEISVNKYDYHPNELGHSIAAKAILKSFINQAILR